MWMQVSFMQGPLLSAKLSASSLSDAPDKEQLAFTSTVTLHPRHPHSMPRCTPRCPLISPVAGTITHFLLLLCFVCSLVSPRLPSSCPPQSFHLPHPRASPPLASPGKQKSAAAPLAASKMCSSPKVQKNKQILYFTVQIVFFPCIM